MFALGEARYLECNSSCHLVAQPVGYTFSFWFPLCPRFRIHYTYFFAQQLDSPCGSIVFAYHNQGEANDAYTAGRINFDVTDSSGAENVDPNASNLKHTLTLDIGGLSTNQEYVVTY